MTHTLARAREVLAEALSEIDGLNIVARPPRSGIPRAGDGWVAVSEVRPADYTRHEASLAVLIVLGRDVTSAEELLDTYACDILDTASTIDDFPYSDLSLTPAELTLAEGGTLPGAIVRIATEVIT